MSTPSTTHPRTALRPGLAAQLAAPQVPQPADPIHLLRRTMVSLVADDGPDLTARQMAVFLTVHTQDGPHTVRGMAANLNVSKPAITRALDRLGELEMVRRTVDPKDRRSVLAQRTLKGAAYLRTIRDVMAAAIQVAQ